MDFTYEWRRHCQRFHKRTVYILEMGVCAGGMGVQGAGAGSLPRQRERILHLPKCARGAIHDENPFRAETRLSFAVILVRYRSTEQSALHVQKIKDLVGLLLAAD
jgi:hypothetical protein